MKILKMYVSQSLPFGLWTRWSIWADTDGFILVGL